jgi:uncharacterized protein (TIGR02265 family)
VSPVFVDLARAAQTLDLPRRLAAVPTTAMVRGVFFNLIEADLARRGLLGHPAWHGSALHQRRSHELYGARDLLTLASTAGALLHADPLEGMRQVHASTATYFASTWYGRAFRRFLHPDPGEALAWIERSRHFVANYGRWRYEPRGFGKGILHMFDEYCYIEAIQRGGCEGLLTACGVRGTVDVELDTPYQGRLVVAWEPRN